MALLLPCRYCEQFIYGPKTFIKRSLQIKINVLELAYRRAGAGIEVKRDDLLPPYVCRPCFLYLEASPSFIKRSGIALYMFKNHMRQCKEKANIRANIEAAASRAAAALRKKKKEKRAAERAKDASSSQAEKTDQRSVADSRKRPLESGGSHPAAAAARPAERAVTAPAAAAAKIASSSQAEKTDEAAGSRKRQHFESDGSNPSASKRTKSSDSAFVDLARSRPASPQSVTDRDSSSHSSMSSTSDGDRRKQPKLQFAYDNLESIPQTIGEHVALTLPDCDEMHLRNVMAWVQAVEPHPVESDEPYAVGVSDRDDDATRSTSAVDDMNATLDRRCQVACAQQGLLNLTTFESVEVDCDAGLSPMFEYVE